MRVHHVVVPLVDGDVDRLADSPSRVVDPRRGVGELHEVPEVFDRAVAAAAVEVADERGAVCRGEDRPLTAEFDVVRAIPRDLDELLRGRRLHKRPAETSREPDALSIDRCACSREELERVRRAVELDADLFENPFGVRLEQGEALFAQHLDGLQCAREERLTCDLRLQAGCLAPRPAAASTSTFGHVGHAGLLPVVARRRRVVRPAPDVA